MLSPCTLQWHCQHLAAIALLQSIQTVWCHLCLCCGRWLWGLLGLGDIHHSTPRRTASARVDVRSKQSVREAACGAVDVRRCLPKQKRWHGLCKCFLGRPRRQAGPADVHLGIARGSPLCVSCQPKLWVRALELAVQPGISAVVGALEGLHAPPRFYITYSITVKA